MPESIPLFLAAVAVGCYIQTVTGFALGIFVLTVVSLTQVASIPVTATALNIMNLMLASVVVLPRLRQVNWRLVVLSLAGGLPAMALGVFALGTHPLKSSKRDPGFRDVVVRFGGVEFVPGQHVYADRDGVVVAATPIHLESEKTAADLKAQAQAAYHK